MEQIGARIYFDKITGAILAMVGERQSPAPGCIRETTIEEDVASFTELKERERDSFDYVEWEYGQYAQDMKEGRLAGIDPETKKPLFIRYDEPEQENPTPKPPLSEQLEALKKENELLRAQNAALSDRADFIEDVVAEIAAKVYQ